MEKSSRNRGVRTIFCRPFFTLFFPRFRFSAKLDIFGQQSIFILTTIRTFGGYIADFFTGKMQLIPNLRLFYLLSGITQHIFYKYHISAGRILDKHMSYCSDHFSILQNRASAESLHDPACSLKKFFICYLYYKALIRIFMIQIDSFNFCVVFLYLTIHTAKNCSRSCFYFLFMRNWHLF